MYSSIKQNHHIIILLQNFTVTNMKIIIIILYKFILLDIIIKISINLSILIKIFIRHDDAEILHMTTVFCNHNGDLSVS